MIVVRVALSSLPRAVFLLAMALFMLSVVGTLVALGTFWYDTDFWYYFGVEKNATLGSRWADSLRTSGSRIGEASAVF